MNRTPCYATVFFFLLLSGAAAIAHEPTPVTHSFDRGVERAGPRLILRITEPSSGRLLAARFSVEVDGQTYVPDWIDGHGIRFKSIHRSKRQEFTAFYARGTSPVSVGLPPGAKRVEVMATRGFEFLPNRKSGLVENERVSLDLPVHRWIDLEAQGWIGVDEHLHYDRLDSTADATWLAMLEADGLSAGHFMVLKGGMMPGIWSHQFAYGPKGQATDSKRLIVPGQEYRDSAQGHINLLGVREIIEPISTGGMGTPATPENFPPLHDVLVKARSLDAFVGVAHAGGSGRSSTAVADAVLGAMDFWELGNGFNYSTDTWYRLMNCGFFLPPAAGTDLPNWPFRDEGQPMLGSIRMYVQTGGRIDFPAFKEAMSQGRAFITAGPIVQLSVDGKGPGETIQLPAGGGTVTIRAELRSPQPLRGFHLVHNGRKVDATVRQSKEGVIHHWTIEHRMAFSESAWIAAAGTGSPIKSLNVDAMAHTGAVRVLVNDRPVRSREDLTHFIEALARPREFYRTEGKYRNESERLHAVAVFDRAIARLRERLEEAR